MNAASEKRLSRLMPEFAQRVKLIAERVRSRGFTVEVTQGLRTFAEQDALFSQGRTRRGPRVTNARAGQSLHNYGLAADFALIVAGRYAWPDPHPVWDAIADEAVNAGLEAGARWPKPDKPHVEVANLGWRELLTAYRHGKLTAAWDLARTRL